MEPDGGFACATDQSISLNSCFPSFKIVRLRVGERWMESEIDAEPSLLIFSDESPMDGNPPAASSSVKTLGHDLVILLEQMHQQVLDKLERLSSKIDRLSSKIDVISTDIKTLLKQK
ncbi:hypothetical protein HHK36_030289 [Tetracentron sinense]|uniref:Uncharacterized protein n=1 Tax=Tetracentron sinense TaxID=13715 RepID=A0A835D1E9_TETSI|nr:hypothetical protein HHK36_030289 [Tetracentron sinense]